MQRDLGNELSTLKPAGSGLDPSHVRLYLKPHLGHIELTKLRAERLDAVYAQIRQQEKRPSPATIARIHATARASLGFALKRGRVAFNPALQVELEPVEPPPSARLDYPATQGLPRAGNRRPLARSALPHRSDGASAR